MTITPAQAVAQVDSPRHDWDELSVQYKRHCREIAAAAIAAHKVLGADVPLAQPEYMPPAPSFHAERDGTLGEVEVGDRFMWDGRWWAAEHVETRPDGRIQVRCPATRDPLAVITCFPETLVRIQKRATTAEGPPAEMRLPGGDVAYQTMRAGEVVPGMWVENGAGCWHQVTAIRLGTTSTAEMVRVEYDDDFFWCGVDTKVKVASTVDGARLAAERKAMQAEAYDTACEART